jgi:hypothetical protein
VKVVVAVDVVVLVVASYGDPDWEGACVQVEGLVGGAGM